MMYNVSSHKVLVCTGWLQLVNENPQPNLTSSTETGPIWYLNVESLSPTTAWQESCKSWYASTSYVGPTFNIDDFH